MSVASSLLSLARASTSLVFHQRFGSTKKPTHHCQCLPLFFPPYCSWFRNLRLVGSLLVFLLMPILVPLFIPPIYNLSIIHWQSRALFLYTQWFQQFWLDLIAIIWRAFFKVSIFSLRKGVQTSKKGLLLRFLTTASCHLIIKCKIKYRGIRYGRDISGGIKCQQKLGQDGSGMSWWIGIGHFDLKNFQGKSAKVKYNPNFSRFFS